MITKLVPATCQLGFPRQNSHSSGQARIPMAKLDDIASPRPIYLSIANPGQPTRQTWVRWRGRPYFSSSIQVILGEKQRWQQPKPDVLPGGLNGTKRWTRGRSVERFVVDMRARAGRGQAVVVVGGNEGKLPSGRQTMHLLTGVLAALARSSPRQK